MHYAQKNNLFLSRLTGISPNFDKNYACHDFQFIAKISGYVIKISGNIKFPEPLQPYSSLARLIY